MGVARLTPATMTAPAPPQQYVLLFAADEAPVEPLDPDADTPYDYPVKTRVAAAGLPPPVTTAVRSIWDMAAVLDQARRMARGGRFGDASGFKTSSPEPVKATTVVREGGVTRNVGAQYPANRWTEEREEQERQRRARQKPPRPVKGARTRGKKVRVWDGEEFDG